jgi:hypothetical protein
MPLAYVPLATRDALQYWNLCPLVRVRDGLEYWHLCPLVK